MRNFKIVLTLIILSTAIISTSCKKNEDKKVKELVPKYNLIDSYSIIIYGNTGCCYCDNLETALDENNITYTYYNISDNSDIMSEMYTKLRSIDYYDLNVNLPVVDVTTDSTHILIQPDFETDVIPLITE